jgi:competence protein ComEA
MMRKTMVVLSFVSVVAAASAASAVGRDEVAPWPVAPVAEAAQTAGGEAPAAPSGVVNINTATAEQLQLLPGVGPSRAQAIIAYREQHPFRRAEDLVNVRGIGRATLNHLLPYVTVDGQTTLNRPVPSIRRRSR